MSRDPLRHILRRLGAKIPETPAPALPPASGQAGGGSSPLAPASQPVAPVSGASPAANAVRQSGGGSPYTTHPDRLMEQFVRDEERKAR